MAQFPTGGKPQIPDPACKATCAKECKQYHLQSVAEATTCATCLGAACTAEVASSCPLHLGSAACQTCSIEGASCFELQWTACTTPCTPTKDLFAVPGACAACISEFVGTCLAAFEPCIFKADSGPPYPPKVPGLPAGI